MLALCKEHKEEGMRSAAGLYDYTRTYVLLLLWLLLGWLNPLTCHPIHASIPLAIDPAEEGSQRQSSSPPRKKKGHCHHPYADLEVPCRPIPSRPRRCPSTRQPLLISHDNRPHARPDDEHGCDDGCRTVPLCFVNIPQFVPCPAPRPPSLLPTPRSVCVRHAYRRGLVVCECP